MKKTVSFLVSLLLSLLLAVPAMAGDMDLARAESGDLSALAGEVKAGRRVFDQTGTLDSAQSAQLQSRLSSLEAKYGQTFAIILVNDQAYGQNLEKYCDEVYSGGEFDEEYDGNGVLLVLDLGEKGRGVQIYAKDGARRYVTDTAIDQAFDSYDGGMMTLLGAGRYYDALILYTGFLDALYAQGVQQNEYNYNPETGEKDYAYPRHSVKLWHIFAALLIAGIAAGIPVLNVKNQYAMTLEKRQAQNVNLAYRATAAFAFAGAADAMIGKHVVHVPIPRSDDSSRGGGPSLGGGQSTGHSSVGGGTYTSGGRKF